MKSQNNQKEINIGVDTGKLQLDIYIRPLDIFFSVSNDLKGISSALKKIKKYHPTRIIIEATGRLEFEFIAACAKASLPFVVANPVHIRKFAGATGQLAKTDQLDAKIIAHYGDAIKPDLSRLKPSAMRDMSDLLSRRWQLINLQTMEKNRLHIMPKKLQGSIKALLTVLKKQLEKINKKLIQCIENNEEYQRKNAIIQSLPGAGQVVAVSLICDMPELGYINHKQAAALIGVAPINRESGQYRGKRKIRGGRVQIRTVLYMAMLSAIQHNPVFKGLYQRLLKAGKAKKVAIMACVRKMIIILNSMLRDGVCWNAELALKMGC